MDATLHTETITFQPQPACLQHCRMYSQIVIYAKSVAFSARMMRAMSAASSMYRTDLGRILASPLLFRTLARSGAGSRSSQAADRPLLLVGLLALEAALSLRIRGVRPEAAGHALSQPVDRAQKVFEPVVTMGWHMLLDLPRWLRFSKLLAWGRPPHRAAARRHHPVRHCASRRDGRDVLHHPGAEGDEALGRGRLTPGPGRAPWPRAALR